MGSGAGAKRESAQAGKLVENFLRAGMEPGEAVETVSSALALRGEDVTISESAPVEPPKEQADFCAGALFAAMQELRAAADELESLTGKAYWPFPTYGELLFNI